MTLCCYLISMILLISNSMNLISNYNHNGRLFSDKKAYYEIESIVDLEGKTIDLHKGAVIEFRGGQIKNGVLNCNDNVIKGIGGLSETVSLKGRVKGPFDLSVFQLSEKDESFDFGPIVNNAAQVCKNIVIPEGKYYFKTPIVLEDMRYYQQYGDLVFFGKETNVTAIQFLRGESAVINVMGKVMYDTHNNTINYTKTDRTEIIGVEFVNFNNSLIYIGDVEYFNNNIRVSGYGAGNSYNKYFFGISVFANEHLRIFQKDYPAKQIGWCNENTFFGGRFCNWSHFDWDNCESVAISIMGEEIGDSYNGSNSLLFIKPCMESFKNYAVYAKNVDGCHWQDARTEHCGKFVFFEGVCRNNRISSSYGTSAIDYSHCNTYPLVLDDMFPVFTMDNNNKEGELILEMETSIAKSFKVVFGPNNSKARIGIVYVDNNNGHEIPISSVKTLKKPISTSHPNSYYYNSYSKSWMLASDSSKSEFVIPDDVSRVKLHISGQFDEITIYSNKSTRVTIQ